MKSIFSLLNVEADKAKSRVLVTWGSRSGTAALRERLEMRDDHRADFKPTGCQPERLLSLATAFFGG